MARAMCFLSVLLLSGCGYTADDYWDMVKGGLARSLCNVANKSNPADNCQSREGTRAN